MAKSTTRTHALVECALMIALATILSPMRWWNAH